MSTKCTIAHDPSFRFYQEVLDGDHVYLELRTTQFEARYGEVVVSIPVHIWETIRHLGGARLDLVDQEDSELLATVEANVDKRMAAYQEAMRERPERAQLLNFTGCLQYGAAEDLRADQIQRGMQYYQRERQHQREIRERIATLRRANSLADVT